MRLAFPRAQAIKALLSTTEGAWSLDLTLVGSPFALPLVTALATGVLARPVVSKEAPSALFAPGFARDGFREFFLRSGAVPGASGILTLERKEDGAWSAKLARSLVPFVLSKDAVANNEMPPPGSSGLPESLERVVPLKLRFWEEQDPAKAAEKRAALVAAEFFSEPLLKVVDGDIRLCVQQLFLYEPDEATTKSVDTREEVLSKMLAPFEANLHQPMAEPSEARDEALRVGALDPKGLLLLDEQADHDLITKALLTAGPQGEWCLVTTDSPRSWLPRSRRPSQTSNGSARRRGQI